VALEHAGSPWLTVVTVVKDDPAGFAATVESLAAQDLSAVEYVVVDGSADSTGVLMLSRRSERRAVSTRPCRPVGSIPR
jgi:hypothetical protein